MTMSSDVNNKDIDGNNHSKETKNKSNDFPYIFRK